MFALSPLPRSPTAALRDATSSKPEVRLSALRDLVRHARAGQAEAAAALGRALTDAADEVRAAAALGLADANVADHVPSLIEMARQDAASRARQMALLALGELAEPQSEAAVSVLREAYAARVPEERFQALLALHQIGAQAAEAAVLESLLDPDPEIRRLGFRIAEARWADAPALPELVRARARAGLSALQPAVRTAAALLLGRYGDTSGAEVLLLIVARRMPNTNIEDDQAALELVAALGLSAARESLQRRAFGWFAQDPLMYDARIALARLGDARARQSILKALDAWTFRARTLAAVAAGRARLHEATGRLQELLAHPERADSIAVREALQQLEAEPSS